MDMIIIQSIIGCCILSFICIIGEGMIRARFFTMEHKWKWFKQMFFETSIFIFIAMITMFSAYLICLFFWQRWFA